MSYAERMQELAHNSFVGLFEGVQSITLTDFPDHPNVGDSAIAVGEFAFFDRASILVPEVRCIGTFSRTVLRSDRTVAIHGGGNIAGAFAGIDAHRNRIARELKPDTLLIQLPQSVHFFSSAGRRLFVDEFAARRGTRFAVRDQESLQLVESLIPDARLVPDAVHHLGEISSAEPTQRVVSLIRRDQESVKRDTASLAGVDWPKDRLAMRAGASARWKARRLGPAGLLLNPKPKQWRRIAQARLARGVDILSAGETVVTDRLHGMLLGLQCGRRVIAVDNNNRKLSKYAETWFGSDQPDVTFARDVDEAHEIARSGTS
jgi:pyruvyl transferase EpsO